MLALLELNYRPEFEQPTPGLLRTFDGQFGKQVCGFDCLFHARFLFIISSH